METHTSLLQSVLDRTIDNRIIFGASFALKQNGTTWQGASGNLHPETPYFIASTTKLFTTALILGLRSEGKLQLNDPVTSFLGEDLVRGIHQYKSKDYTSQLTIAHLLAHTSGLPDYFQDRGPEGVSLESEIKEGKDQDWSFDQVLERCRRMKAVFPPDAGKAHYSDVNFQLLGQILENITGKTYAGLCRERIIEPLGLQKTYLYSDPTDNTPFPLYYKSGPLYIPRAMTSFRADGGIVSTSGDMLVFIEAFFTGRLFPASFLPELYHWKRIFFPMQSGVGVHLFRLPWLMNPFGVVPDFIGHSGLSGALAYHCPKENLFIAGTVNQVAHPDRSFRTMIRLTQTLLKHRGR